MSKSSEPPYSSLIITAYHKDQEMIDLTINCLKSLEHGRPDEVIVVDDGSPIMVGLEGVDVYHRRDNNGGFPRCANTGFKLARGHVIILSNNDITFVPGWLEGILKPLSEGYDISHVNVGDSEDSYTSDEITEDDRYGSLWAQTREVYERLGGFDTRFTKGTHEDLDHMVRAKREGFKIGKNHAITVGHVGRATMDKLYPNQEDFYESQQIFKDKHGFII